MAFDSCFVKDDLDIYLLLFVSFVFVWFGLGFFLFLCFCYMLFNGWLTLIYVNFV